MILRYNYRFFISQNSKKSNLRYKHHIMADNVICKSCQSDEFTDTFLNTRYLNNDYLPAGIFRKDTSHTYHRSAEERVLFGPPSLSGIAGENLSVCSVFWSGAKSVAKVTGVGTAGSRTYKTSIDTLRPLLYN